MKNKTKSPPLVAIRPDDKEWFDLMAERDRLTQRDMMSAMLASWDSRSPAQRAKIIAETLFK